MEDNLGDSDLKMTQFIILRKWKEENSRIKPIDLRIVGLKLVSRIPVASKYKGKGSPGSLYTKIIQMQACELTSVDQDTFQ